MMFVSFFINTSGLHRGFQRVQSRKDVRTLRNAEVDDIILIANTLQGLQSLLNRVLTVNEEYVLKLNI